MLFTDRIVVNSEVLAGKPVVKGTRLAVEFILELLAAGQTESELLESYPGLTHEDILACSSYAAAWPASAEPFRSNPPSMSIAEQTQGGAITPAEFVAFYPCLYHMAEIGTWEAIKANGLLSTTALLDLFEYSGEERRRIELAHRKDSVSIKHRRYGTAFIRDQRPMSDSALWKCLVGMEPGDWYAELNGKVFFWVTPEQVFELLNARSYRDRLHTVITVDTAALFKTHGNRIVLSHINSGSTIHKPVERGRHTFKTLDQYPFKERRKLRGLKNAVKELCVQYAVPDISVLTIKVEIRQGNNVIEVLYPS